VSVGGLFRLEQKKQERWEEVVDSIDFSQLSCKAWNTINKLTGRGLDAPLACALSRQTPSPRNLWRTGLIGPRAESTRFLSKELSGWRIEGPNTWGKVSLTFWAWQLATALRRLKPGKVFWSCFHLPGVYSPRWAVSQTLVLRFLHFLHWSQGKSSGLVSIFLEFILRAGPSLKP